jgi:radical SAM protein with 4Fe4S-binding SPASM domain
MQARLRNFLLSSSSYKIARKFYKRLEQHDLERCIRTLLQTGLTPLPDTVFLEPTQRCNLRCKMCYQDRVALNEQGEMTLSQIIEFFDDNLFLRKVALCGGEIFVRRDVAELIRHLDKTRDIVISTNGTLIGDSEISLLRSCRRLVSVCISLDGPKPIHDSIRGIPGSFEKVIRTIKTLAPIVPVSITCVILKENLEFLPNIVDQCAEMGVKKMKLELERIYTENSKSQASLETDIESETLPLSSGRERGYSLESFQNTIHECKKRADKVGLHLTFDPEFLMEETEGCYGSNLRRRRHYICQAFRMATVTPSGDLIHCYAIRKPFGNVVDFPLEKIWNSDSANTFRKELLRNNLTSVCENCLHLRPVRRNLLLLN